MLFASSPPRRPPRNSLQLTEPRESLIRNDTIFVLPFLVSRMSSPETSPRTVQRPTSSVSSFMGSTGSWMGLP